MPYNKRFFKYIIKNKIINGNPRFELLWYDPARETHTKIKELPAQCEYIDIDYAIGAQCTATDTSSDTYTINEIQLHVNTYSYSMDGVTVTGTGIDSVNYKVTKNASDQLKIVDKVTFTAAKFVEV